MLWVQLFPIKVRNTIKLLSDFSAGPTSKPADFSSHSASQKPLSSQTPVVTPAARDEYSSSRCTSTGPTGKVPQRLSGAFSPQGHCSQHVPEPALIAADVLGGSHRPSPVGKTTRGGTGCG